MASIQIDSHCSGNSGVFLSAAAGTHCITLDLCEFIFIPGLWTPSPLWLNPRERQLQAEMAWVRFRSFWFQTRTLTPPPPPIHTYSPPKQLSNYRPTEIYSVVSMIYSGVPRTHILKPLKRGSEHIALYASSAARNSALIYSHFIQFHFLKMLFYRQICMYDNGEWKYLLAVGRIVYWPCISWDAGRGLNMY